LRCWQSSGWGSVTLAFQRAHVYIYIYRSIAQLITPAFPFLPKPGAYRHGKAEGILWSPLCGSLCRLEDDDEVGRLAVRNAMHRELGWKRQLSNRLRPADSAISSHDKLNESCKLMAPYLSAEIDAHHHDSLPQSCCRSCCIRTFRNRTCRCPQKLNVRGPSGAGRVGVRRS
jgi:hypothetical protein